MVQRSKGQGVVPLKGTNTDAEGTQNRDTGLQGNVHRRGEREIYRKGRECGESREVGEEKHKQKQGERKRAGKKERGRVCERDPLP